MRFFQVVLSLLAVMFIWQVNNGRSAVAAETAHKARVNLLIAGQPGAPITSYHEWSRELGTAGVRNVRIRAAQSSDRLDIQTRGSEQYPVYEVTGMIESGGDLLLPGARFSLGDAIRVARWVEDLAKEGPPQSREPQGPFGLKKSRFDKVYEDLRQVVDFPTHGETRAAAVKKIAEDFNTPLQIEPALMAALVQDKITDELAGFAGGTALACVLRPLGLGFTPAENDGGELIYAVLPIGADAAATKTWPVGWPPQGPRAEVLPGLFKFHTVGIQNVSLAEVLEKIGGKLKVPVLIDRAALARAGVDAEKIDVSLPRARTTYGLALNRVLFKEKLKYELLVDEAGRPFLWVTTLKRQQP